MSLAPSMLSGDASRSPASRDTARRIGVFAGYLFLVAVVAALDLTTGYDFRLAILYLFPIALATWHLGGAAGTVMAAAATLAWIASFESLHPYAHDAFFYWEGAAKGVTYFFIVGLVARLRRALVRSDERFATVLDGLAAAVFVEDPDTGTVLYANPRHVEKFGADRPRFLLERPIADHFAGEVRDDASGHWYLLRSRPLRWVDGRQVRLRLLSDVTEEKRVRDLVERHRDALHRSARLIALGEFASAIAHEINQPLAAIAAYNASALRLLQAGQAGSPEVEEAVRKCRDQARRAGAIVQRLRELLRQPAPALGRQDLNAVARAAVETVEGEMREAGVALELALAPVLPPVRADALLMEQVLVNLLRNAVEAVRALPPARRRVSLASEATGRSVAISVRDGGDGPAPGIRERLFEPFATDKPAGLGLGLSICRSVVETHGGRIEADFSAGSCFRVVVPQEEPS